MSEHEEPGSTVVELMLREPEIVSGWRTTGRSRARRTTTSRRGRRRYHDDR